MLTSLGEFFQLLFSVGVRFTQLRGMTIIEHKQFTE